MSSAIDPTKPGEGTAYTSDVRANFLAAKQEIEALQAVQATDTYHVVHAFNYFTDAQKTDAIAGNLTFDSAALLQDAIDYASTLASYSNGRSIVKVIIAAGKYRLDNQLVVKAHVDLDCQGVLHNNLSVSTDFCVHFKKDSHCTRITVDGNSKGGVLFGENAQTCNMRAGEAFIFGVATTANHRACRFEGDGFLVGQLDVTGGEVSVELGDNSTKVASNFICSKIVTHQSGTGFLSTLSNRIRIGKLFLDSHSSVGARIDTSSVVEIDDAFAYFNDSVGGTAYGSGYAFDIGANSSGNRVSNLRLNARVDNTNGVALRVSHIEHSDIQLAANRGTLTTGNAKNVTTAITYGTGVQSSLIIKLNLHSAITASSGTIVGQLLYWDGTTYYSVQPTYTPTVLFQYGSLLGDYRGIKSSDQSLTSQTTLQNATDMVFAIGASQVWLVEMFLSLGAALATTGAKLAITVPSGGTALVMAQVVGGTFVAANKGSLQGGAGATLDFTSATQASQTDVMATVVACIVNSTNAGNVQLQFAQSTSSGTALTLRAASWFRATRFS